MATGFTNRLVRQSRLFAVTLILLWGVIIAFVGLRFWIIDDKEHLDKLFIIVAAITTLIVCIIAVVVARLYSSLIDSANRIEREHHLALEQEQEKIRIKRQLTNNINHEIKTPICSILGYMEMILSNEELDCQSVRGFVKKSYDQAERLRRLMLDLSTVTRIEEAAVMIEREVVDLRMLINNIIDDTLPQATAQNIVIRSDVDRDLEIDGNYTLLYSIFRNLVDNAISYSGGRSITISLVAVDVTHYHFSVSDNGIGVEDRHLPYIFERFYRVDKGRSRKAGGTGLGLSIVKNAVHFHNGVIVARRASSGGLDFAFSLRKGELSGDVDSNLT